MMSKISDLMTVMGVCLLLAGCPSGPSSSAPDETSAVEGKIEFIEGMLGRRHDAARLLDELETSLPERVWLTEVEYRDGEARVKGIARSNTLFIDYLSSLERSAALAEVTLRSSAQRSARDRETQEFELRAVLAGPLGDAPRASGPADARLEELEKLFPASGETAGFFRLFQRLASEAGLQMTKFAPEGAVPAGPYEEWSAAIEVMGDLAALKRFFRSLAGLPYLWVADRFSFRTLAADDSRSPVRASIAAFCALAPASD